MTMRPSQVVLTYCKCSKYYKTSRLSLFESILILFPISDLSLKFLAIFRVLVKVSVCHLSIFSYQYFFARSLFVRGRLGKGELFYSIHLIHNLFHIFTLTERKLIDSTPRVPLCIFT